MEEYDVVIIGGGCAGLSAAMYTGRFTLKTLVLAEIPGGTIILTDVVENYPGFKKLTGLELAQKLQEHAEDYPSVSIQTERVDTVKKEGKYFYSKTSEGEYKSKTIIFCTGTKWKKLEVPNEDKYANKGIHYCALCDGAFYKDKVVAIIGGADSAAKEALLLTQFASKVYMIYRGEKIHPEPINLVRVNKNAKIEIINNTNVIDIKGDEKHMTSVVLDKEYDGSKELKLDAAFVAIGHIVLSDLPKSLNIEVNKKQEVVIDRLARTNIKGVFAAGDLVDTEFKQAITGAGEAVLASYSANEYLANEFPDL